jgi:glycosyltransferase involved in cell wall biosynthesis
MLLTTATLWGGAESLACSQAQHFAAKGWEVTVGSLAEGDGALFREIREVPGIRTFSLGMDKTRWYRIAELQLKLGEVRPNIIIAHLFHSCIAARVFGRLFRGIPVISVFHSTYQERWRVAVDRLTLPLTAKYVVVSEDGAAFARESLGIGEDKLAVVPNGVDSRFFQSPTGPRERIRQELGLSADSTVIGCVARFHLQKDHATLIKAFKRTREANTGRDLKLLLVGAGSELFAMRRLTERLGLLEHVLFTGFRRDLPDIYTAMDLYSQTSRREGLPITILEAMSVGLPIVATAASGVTSVLVDGENGLLAPVGDVKGVGDRITRLLKEPDLAQKLGATAKQQVETQYSLKTCMDAYYDLALSVLGMEQ